MLLADDHPVVREGLRACLVAFPGIEIVGEAADGLDVVAQARQLTPDVVLMDINLPRCSGIDATERLRTEMPRIKVLALTAHDHREYAVRMVAAGALGYVLKDAPPEELAQAIETVHGGQPFFSSSVAANLIRTLVNKPGGAVPPDSPPLSPREREVLCLIADGRSNKEIASLLNVSVRTVETHREHLMGKLNIHSVAGLTKYAIAQGLTRLE